MPPLELHSLWERVQQTHKLPPIHVDYVFDSDPSDLPEIEYATPYVVYSGVGAVYEQGVVLEGKAHPNRPPEAGAQRERLDVLLRRLYHEEWSLFHQDGAVYVARIHPEPPLTDHFTQYEQRFDKELQEALSRGSDEALGLYKSEHSPPYEVVFFALLGAWKGQEQAFFPWLSGMKYTSDRVSSELWMGRQAFLGERFTDSFEEDFVHQRSPGKFPSAEHVHPDFIEDREEDEETSDGIAV